jgi:hypothetical protein
VAGICQRTIHPRARTVAGHPAIPLPFLNCLSVRACFPVKFSSSEGTVVGVRCTGSCSDCPFARSVFACSVVRPCPRRKAAIIKQTFQNVCAHISTFVKSKKPRSKNHHIIVKYFALNGAPISFNVPEADLVVALYLMVAPKRNGIASSHARDDWNVKYGRIHHEYAYLRFNERYVSGRAEQINSVPNTFSQRYTMNWSTSWVSRIIFFATGSIH